MKLVKCKYQHPSNKIKNCMGTFTIPFISSPVLLSFKFLQSGSAPPAIGLYQNKTTPKRSRL